MVSYGRVVLDMGGQTVEEGGSVDLDVQKVECIGEHRNRTEVTYDVDDLLDTF